MLVLRAELHNGIAYHWDCYVEVSSRDVVMQRYHGRDSMMSKIDQHGALPCKDIKDTVCVPGQKDTVCVPGQKDTVCVPGQKDTVCVPGQNSSVILKDLTCAILWYVIQGY